MADYTAIRRWWNTCRTIDRAARTLAAARDHESPMARGSTSIRVG